MKKLFKIAGAACAAAGVVAVSTLVASGAAAGAIAEGFKSANRAMKRIMNDLEHEADTLEDQNRAESAE